MCSFDLLISLTLLVKNNDLKQDIRKVEQSYESIKAQKNTLKAELKELKLWATSDSEVEGSSKKRRRQEWINRSYWYEYLLPGHSSFQL
jgi:hypothetical protein